MNVSPESGQIQVSSTGSSSTPVPSSSPIKLSPMAMQAEITRILVENGSFEAKGKRVLDFLKSQNLEAFEKLVLFKDAHHEKIARLKHEGWSTLKDQLGIAMKTAPSPNECSWETFREKCTELISSATLAMSRDMGFDPPGSYSATGTPGYASDIDTVFLDPKEMPEATKISIKILFDLIWNATFEGLSGPQADIESYLNHPGAAYDTYQRIQSPEGKSQFCCLELSLSMLQMHRALRNNPEAWNEYFENQVNKSPNPHIRHALDSIIKEVSIFEREIHADLIKYVLHEHLHIPKKDLEELPSEKIFKRAKQSDYKELLQSRPELEQQAAMEYKIPRLIALSVAMDQDKHQLNLILNEIRNLSPPSASTRLDQLTKTAELLELRIAARGALRNCFFDESYLTQGAFNKTCLLAGGQIQQRVDEKARAHRRKSIVANTPFAPHAAKHSEPKQKETATLQENLISQQENLGMYVGHFSRHALHTDPSHALVSASKYSLRALESSMQMLAAIAHLVPPEQASVFKELQTQCEQLTNMAAQLEACKRSVQINSTATKFLLMEELRRLNIPPKRKLEIEKIVDEICQRGDTKGPLQEPDTLPEDKLIVLVSHLLETGLIHKEVLTSPHGPIIQEGRIDAILRARCGFPIVEVDGQKKEVINSTLQQIHKEAEKITIEALELDAPNNAFLFNREIEGIVTRVRNFSMTLPGGAVPPSSISLDISLLGLWQQTKK